MLGFFFFLLSRGGGESPSRRMRGVGSHGPRNRDRSATGAGRRRGSRIRASSSARSCTDRLGGGPREHSHRRGRAGGGDQEARDRSARARRGAPFEARI